MEIFDDRSFGSRLIDKYIRCSSGNDTMSDDSDVGNEFDALMICYNGTINVHRNIIAKSSKILKYMISRLYII